MLKNQIIKDFQLQTPDQGLKKFKNGWSGSQDEVDWARVKAKIWMYGRHLQKRKKERKKVRKKEMTLKKQNNTE